MHMYLALLCILILVTLCTKYTLSVCVYGSFAFLEDIYIAMCLLGVAYLFCRYSTTTSIPYVDSIATDTH